MRISKIALIGFHSLVLFFYPFKIHIPNMLSAPAIHQTATTGFGNANAYDKHRPTYPFGAVQELLEKIDVAGKTGAKLVDLAAGTGKLTEVLAARTEGFRILAVEPHASMRQTLEEKNLKGVETKMGTAEDMGVEDGWADAVVVAQVWGALLFSPLS